MQTDDWSFLADARWRYQQADGSYYVAKNSKLAALKLPLTIRIYEDLKRGEIIVLSSTDGKKYQGEALFEAPEFMPYEKDDPLECYAADELWPRMIIWEITLKSEADAWSDLILQRDQSVASAKLLEGGGMMSMMMVPEEHANELWLGLESQSGDMNLNVFAPEGFTNRVEIYSCTDLVSSVWSIAVQNLYPSGTNPAVWSTGLEIGQFFRAGNMDVDSDSDGINDAREQFVYKTVPDRWDSDGDWIPDGWETTNSLNALTGDGGADADGDGLSNRDEYQRGTDPHNSDTDHDGLSDGAEVLAGTDPLQSDTDGDGLPDGWEVRFGYDPVNVAGALSGADQVGNFDTAGSALAIEVRGDIAYVADGTNGLVIADVRHPGGRNLSSLALGGEANDLLLTNNTLWVALGSNGVAAVDVGDPFCPKLLGTHYTGGYSCGMALQSNLLFVANTSKGMLILDVQHLEDIVQIGLYHDYFQGGQAIGVKGTNAWLALSDRMVRLNISNPSNPVLVGGTTGLTTCRDMKVVGEDVFCGGSGLSIWNADLTLQRQIDTGSGVYGFGMESNRVLVAAGINLAKLIDISDEQNPELLADCVLSGFAGDAVLRGERGYLAAGEGGLITVRFSTDNDADGMDDNWESRHFGSISASATNDFDGDGILNREEFMIGTSPTNTDSDADGLSDGDEVHLYGSDPTRADGDLDGLSDYDEINVYHTDAGKADTDGDGMPDGWEVFNGFNPLVADENGDADSDGLFNLTEYLNHTNPQVSDSDGDGLSDAWEVFNGTSNASTNRSLRASFEQVTVRDTAGEARGLVVADGYLYVADGSNGLAIFDLSIPSAPSLAATLDTAGFAYDVVVSNHYAYIADGVNGLVIVAVSNPASPSVTGHYDTPGSVQGLDVKDNYAYLADGSGMYLRVIDISNPAAPALASQLYLPSPLYDIFVRGNSAYFAAFQSVGRLDVSNPAAPQVYTHAAGFLGVNALSVHGNDSIVVAVLGTSGVRILNDASISNYMALSSYDTAGTASGVFVDGDYAYVADGSAGVLILNISTPTNPVMKYQRDTAGNALDIFPNGEYVYVADGTNGIAVFRFVEDTDQDGMSDFWERRYFGDLSQSATNDFDGDGLSNWAEYLIAGNPSTNDADGDLLSDYAEVWTYHTQPLNKDSDFDGRDDRAEVLGLSGVAATDPLNPDCDGDDLKDGAEITAGSNPHVADTDGDGMPDGWEVANGLGPTIANPSTDLDLDGLSNLAEYQQGSKANVADTDNDGLNDGDEVAAGTGLLNSDSDGDGLTDGAEVHTHNTNPLNVNSDGDSMPDGWEVTNGLNPLVNDASCDKDYDGLTNEQEYQVGTKANNSDSDGDGYSDSYEITHGLSPTNSDSDGDGVNDKQDKQPGSFEVMIPATVTNEFDFVDMSGNYNSPTPLYVTTYNFIPSNLPPTNIAFSITNVVMQGWVWDAFKINGTNYAWSPNPKEFTNNITSNVVATLGGTNVAGFAIDLYKWESSSFYTPCSLSAQVIMQLKKAVPLDLVADYDRNGIIDTNDLASLRSGKLFRFWVNDDDDSGYDGGQDIPGQGSLNYIDSRVNGVRDLIDFFPVALNITNILGNVGITNGYRFYLCHDEGALNVVQTTLTTNTAGNYLRNVSTANELANAAAAQITQSGWRLPDAFLNDILNNGKGIVLIEARAPTDKPLRLELRRVNTNNVEELIGKRELPLSISGVEQMFRHKNLRAEIGTGGKENVGDRSTATNWPDSLCSATNLFFLHGVNTDEQSARGWQSEFFKRFYWSGSKARFHGITWYGDKGSDANYQENVNHAFKTAAYLKDYVASVGGTKIMLAHSLGNMVVSSAIEDHGMNVGKYLMLDAAVASEAFDGSLFSTATNNNPMLHADWRGYEPQTWSANFHELYSYPDKRAELTWQNRFSSVVPQAYNFYSSEDEVFEINPLSVGMLTGVEFDLNIWQFSVAIHGLSRYVWQKQEVFKGRDSSWLPGSLGSTKWWGWGFHSLLESTGHANGLSTNELRKSPVFRHNPDFYFRVDNLNTEAVNEMLAMGLPAMSPSVGLTNIAAILPAKNINISTLKENGWPRNEQPYLQRWLHSDCKDVAYLYTYRLFEELTAKGGLK
jgi:hypothetical protein